MYFLLISAFPLLICLSLFVIYAILGREYAPTVLVLAVILLAIIGITTSCMFKFGPKSESADTEIWNGRISARYSEQVSCSHSYSCNCRIECTGSGKDQSCSTVCDTCYEHYYDVDWKADTTNNETIFFDRIDRQGLHMPPRYAEAFVGEPTAIEHRFVNYFKLATHNVVANFEPGVSGVNAPAYPQQFDLYRVNKLVDDDGIQSGFRNEWLWLLNQLNSDLGAAKQVNVIVVLTRQPDPRFAFNVQKSWLGGKKNDVIVVIGAPAPPSITWVRVISWSTNPAIKSGLRDDIQTVGSLDKRDAIVAAIRKHVVADFQRIHMKDQKYLREEWEPSHGTTVFLIILFSVLAVAGAIGVSMSEDSEFC